MKVEALLDENPVLAVHIIGGEVRWGDANILKSNDRKKIYTKYFINKNLDFLSLFFSSVKQLMLNFRKTWRTTSNKTLKLNDKKKNIMAIKNK